MPDIFVYPCVNKLRGFLETKQVFIFTTFHRIFSVILFLAILRMEFIVITIPVPIFMEIQFLQVVLLSSAE